MSASCLRLRQINSEFRGRILSLEIPNRDLSIVSPSPDTFQLKFGGQYVRR